MPAPRNFINTSSPMGFETIIKVKKKNRLSGKISYQKLRISVAANCREVLAYKVRDRLIKEHLKARIDLILDWPEGHQPDITVLKAYNTGSSKLPSNIKSAIEVNDALTGIVCLLLNPNRYYGNWWRTPIKQTHTHTVGNSYFSWYGTDNFFLAHYSLLSLVFGVFRQALSISKSDQGQVIERLAPRKEVVKALNQSDPDRALYLFNRLQPVFTAHSNYTASTIPIRGANFNFIIELHKALYKYGFTKVLGSPEEAWRLKEFTLCSVLGFQAAYRGGSSKFSERVIKLSKE